MTDENLVMHHNCLPKPSPAEPKGLVEKTCRELGLPYYKDKMPAPERDHDDGRCCENGFFGQQHECRKQPNPEPTAREWWIYEGPSRFKDKNGNKTLSLEVYDHPIEIVNCTQIRVVAKELYMSAKAEVERLKREFLALQVSAPNRKITQLQAALEAKEAECAKWKKLENEKHAECLERMTERNQARAELAEMTALKDKAAEIAIAIGFEHNVKVKELTAAREREGKLEKALEFAKDCIRNGDPNHEANKLSIQLINELASYKETK